MQNLKDLVIALYALIVLYETQTASKDAYAALKSPALKKYTGYLPSLPEVCKEFIGGGYEFATLGEELRTFVGIYKNDPESRASVVKLLAAFATWIRNGSPNALKFLELNSASPAIPNWISTGFVKQVSSQEGVNKKLETLIKKMTGRTGEIGFESPLEASEAKANYPQQYAEFLKLRKEFGDIWRSFLSNYVRSSGGKTVKYEDLLAAMSRAKIRHALPLGFAGKIDAAGRFYSQFDEPLGGTPPQSNIFPKIRMNPDYEEGSQAWVSQAIRKDGTPGNYQYTKLAVRRTIKEKFEKVKNFTPMLPGIRNKWLVQIKKFNPEDPICVGSLVLELIYQTSARVGSKGFGMATLLRKHYSPAVNGFILKYLGKDQVPTKHVYKGSDPLAKHIVKIVAEMAAGKKPNDPLFSIRTRSGVFKKMTPALANAVFHRMGAPKGITVHKIRTYHGTLLFRTIAEKIYAKHKSLNSKEALQFLKVAGEAVGKKLNHVRTSTDGTTTTTSATAISSYIDPEAQVEFFQHYNLPLPKHLEGQLIQSSLISLVAAAIKGEAMDTRPKVVPEPIGKTQETADKEKVKKDEEDSSKVIDISTTETEEELSKEAELMEKQEKIDNKLREELANQAEEFDYFITYGGDNKNTFAEESTFDNILMQERFGRSNTP
jgi:Eukaryotic DNA topoisomerase I, catalytic core